MMSKGEKTRGNGGGKVAGFWSYLLEKIRSGGPLLAVLVFVLVLGFFLGLAAPTTMDEDAASQTRLFIGNYVQALPEAGIKPGYEALQAFLLNGSLILGIGLLGLHLFGLPLAAAMLFFKGLSLGYAMSFLMDYQGTRGFVVIALSMLPQNLVLLPVFVVAALLAANFSLTLHRSKPLFGRDLAVYGMRFLMLLGGVLIGSLVQGYICPLLLKLFFVII